MKRLNLLQVSSLLYVLRYTKITEQKCCFTVDAKSDASNGSLRTEKDFISLMVKSELDQPVDARQTVSFPHFVEVSDYTIFVMPA